LTIEPQIGSPAPRSATSASTVSRARSSASCWRSSASVFSAGSPLSFFGAVLGLAVRFFAVRFLVSSSRTRSS
jgi:hypothetical protein